MPQTLARKTGVIPVFYRAESVVSGYRFDTTRKAQWIADSLIETPIPGLELVEPALVKREPLLAVQALDDVHAIESLLAALNGDAFDLCLYNAGMNPFRTVPSAD